MKSAAFALFMLACTLSSAPADKPQLCRGEAVAITATQRYTSNLHPFRLKLKGGAEEFLEGLEGEKGAGLDKIWQVAATHPKLQGATENEPKTVEPPKDLCPGRDDAYILDLHLYQ